jgi:hypothetical protein
VRFGFNDDGRTVAEFGIGSHFDEKFQSEFKGFRFRTGVMEFFKKISDGSASQRV